MLFTARDLRCPRTASVVLLGPLAPRLSRPFTLRFVRFHEARRAWLGPLQLPNPLLSRAELQFELRRPLLNQDELLAQHSVLLLQQGAPFA